MYERSDSHFSRTTPKIPPEPDAFDESRLFMTFSITMGVREILYSFRLVLEGDEGRDIPEVTRLKFSDKKKKKTSWPLFTDGIQLPQG